MRLRQRCGTLDLGQMRLRNEPDGDHPQIYQFDRSITRGQRIAVSGLHRGHEILGDGFQACDALVLDWNGEETRLTEILYINVSLDLDLVGAHAFAQQRFTRLGRQIVEFGIEFGVIEFGLDLVQRYREFVLDIDTDGTEGGCITRQWRHDDR